MLKKKIQVQGAKVLIMGLAFKENCPDLRNTKVIDVIRELIDFGVEVNVTDPQCDPQAAKQVYDVDLIAPQENNYDGVILAVAHKEYFELGVKGIQALGKENHVLYDLKYVLAKDEVDLRL